MARIKEASVEAVKQAADIVEIVSTRTQLRRSGARFVGRCPFHEERTPSFSVSPDRGAYYCFGCQRGGDAIRFVQETENLDFAGAVEFLAGRFRVPLEYEEASPEAEAQRRRRERLLAVLEQAAGFYERYLRESPAGEAARAYLAGRGLGDEVAAEFRLGLAPTGGGVLARKAQEAGFTRAELAAAGLLNRAGKDWFQGRLLFPLADARGRVRGFQARRLREDDPLQAKYVNSPEGELFRKGDLLYGLDRARSAIAKADRAIVVEGNTDVLALRQAGLDTVVAAMGTALTEQQLRELARLTRRLVLCFDGDAAGAAATLRGLELAARQGFEVRVATLPPGVDPADDPGGFARALAGAVAYGVHLVRTEIARAESRDAALRKVAEILGRLDRADWLEAVEVAADALRLPPDVIRSLPGHRVDAAGAVVLPRGDPSTRLERDVLAACAAHPELLPLLREVSPEHFDSDAHRQVRDALVAGQEPPAELVAHAGEAALDERFGRQSLLRLHARKVERDIRETSEGARAKELAAQLARLREAIRELA